MGFQYIYEQIVDVVLQVDDKRHVLERIEGEDIIGYVIDQGWGDRLLEDMDFDEVAPFFEREEIVGYLMDDDEGFMEVFRVLGESFLALRDSRNGYRRDFQIVLDREKGLRTHNRTLEDEILQLREVIEKTTEANAKLQERMGNNMETVAWVCNPDANELDPSPPPSDTNIMDWVDKV